VWVFCVPEIFSGTSVVVRIYGVQCTDEYLQPSPSLEERLFDAINRHRHALVILHEASLFGGSPRKSGFAGVPDILSSLKLIFIPGKLIYILCALCLRARKRFACAHIAVKSLFSVPCLSLPLTPSFPFLPLFPQSPGKPREATSRTTVFKRAVDVSYRLKMKASR
jgi:hypothetical protein